MSVFLKSYLLLNLSAGHPKTVALLLNYGADVDLKTSDGQTPLFMAVRQNNLTCISHLVNAGANIWESESKSLLNSVHLAGFPLFLGLLYIYSNATVSLISASFGLTAALRVIIADCHPSSMPLAEGLQLVDRNNRDALMLAVSSRNLETFIYLLTQGAVATNLDKSGRSTLHRAAALGMDKASEILIEKGANIMGAAFATGRTAFHYCCQRGESRVLSVLLNHTPADRNLNPNWLDTRGFSPLQWAAVSSYSYTA